MSDRIIVCILGSVLLLVLLTWSRRERPRRLSHGVFTYSTAAKVLGTSLSIIFLFGLIRVQMDLGAMIIVICFLLYSAFIVVESFTGSICLENGQLIHNSHFFKRTIRV